MSPGGRFCRLLERGLIKDLVFLIGDILRVAHPEWCSIVDLFPLTLDDIYHLDGLLGVALFHSNFDVGFDR